MDYYSVVAFINILVLSEKLHQSPASHTPLARAPGATVHRSPAKGGQPRSVPPDINTMEQTVREDVQIQTSRSEIYCPAVGERSGKGAGQSTAHGQEVALLSEICI